MFLGIFSPVVRLEKKSRQRAGGVGRPVRSCPGCLLAE